MPIILTPEQEAIVMQHVVIGRFNSPEEVTDAALQLLVEQSATQQMRIDALRREVQVGIDAADRGELVPFDAEELKAEILAGAELKQAA